MKKGKAGEPKLVPKDVSPANVRFIEGFAFDFDEGLTRLRLILANQPHPHSEAEKIVNTTIHETVNYANPDTYSEAIPAEVFNYIMSMEDLVDTFDKYMHGKATVKDIDEKIKEMSAKACILQEDEDGTEEEA